MLAIGAEALKSTMGTGPMNMNQFGDEKLQGPDTKREMVNQDGMVYRRVIRVKRHDISADSELGFRKMAAPQS